jgi:hypothetical protein
MNEKVMIRIAGINQITEHRVEVILKDTGEKIWLPIGQAERFGDRVFIPAWLGRKYKIEKLDG